MQPLSPKMAHFTNSIIRDMSRVCKIHNAINLAQGFPDFPPPKPLLKALSKVAKKGPHQYALTNGSPKFRAALAKKLESSMDIAINPDDNLVVTCGSTEAMMSAMIALCKEGDKVIVFSPIYENYRTDTLLSGAKPIYIPLIPPDFHFDKAQLESAFAKKPKAIIICNPSNPSGKVFTRDELEFILRLAIKHDSYIIMDEVYEHIIFAPHKHTYMASLRGAFERTITCSSLSKTYSITGWRLGYILAPKDIAKATHKVHDFLTVGAAAPLQEAAIAGLELPQSYYEKLIDKYTKRRDIFCNGLKKLGIAHIRPQGAYFSLVDISEFNYKSDIEFCHKLAENVGVGAVPGSSFFMDGTQHYIRFHFAKKIATLKAALQKMERFKSAMSGGLRG